VRRTLLAAALLCLAAPAAAYELLRVDDNPCARDRQNLFWRGDGVPVATALLPGPQRGLADEARNRWNLSLGSFDFGVGSASPCTRDGVATLTLSSSPCGAAQFGDALAITRTVWTDDGALVDADVAFNADSFIVRDDGAFLEVAMHELGHVLGLDHSDACGGNGQGTLMEARLTPPRLEAPQADDVAGAEAIYGGDPGDGTVPDGANSCAVVAPRGAASAWPWAGVAALLWWRIGRSAGRQARRRRAGGGARARKQAGRPHRPGPARRPALRRFPD
jgi:hypothetical protein